MATILYSLFYGDDLPPIGWKIDGEFVHTFNAFKHDYDWLNHFEKTFPEKAKKMHEYSDNNRWSKKAHIRHWINVSVAWLNKNAEKV